jgi:hypothetical protein
MESVRYMAECTKQEEESDKVREDWKFVAMVLDRLFLWIFSFYLNFSWNSRHNPSGPLSL